MRDRLRRIELSRFWQLRNRFFALKHRLGFSVDSAWDVFEIPPAYASVLDEQDAYAQWRVRNDPRESDLVQMRRTATALAATPAFGIVVLGESEGDRYDASVSSLRAQVYPHWSLVRDGTATGDFVLYLDAGDVLAPEALFAFAVEIARDDSIDIVYADEDDIDSGGARSNPHFKPDWSPETLLSHDYIGRAVAYRRASLGEAVSLLVTFGAAARYDLTLRASESARAIAHVPRVLYHGRSGSGAETSDTYAPGAVAAISEALARRGEAGTAVPNGPGTFVVRYASSGHAPRVSILLPTRDHASELGVCLSSLFARTTYADFELIVIDNGTKERAALETIDRYRARDARVRVLPMDVPFNYSRLNNAAERTATGEYVVLLNNDTEIETPDWIEAMLEQARRPAIGVVGAHLLFPDGSVQHGGVVLGIGGVAGHSHRGHPVGSPGYFNTLQAVTNYSAMTAACLMVRKSVYDEVAGLDETLTVAFNDVDFCLRIGRAGYRNVWLPHVVLRHGESRSRGHDVGLRKTHRSLVEQRVMLERWGDAIANDPYYSPHLTRVDESYAIRGGESSPKT